MIRESRAHGDRTWKDVLGSHFLIPGEKVYLREAWAWGGTLDPGIKLYKQDYPACVPVGLENIPNTTEIKWSSPVTMPLKFARKFFTIVSCDPMRIGNTWVWKIEVKEAT